MTGAVQYAPQKGRNIPFRGTSTWLTFVTLTHNTGSSQLPKVNYIKYLDIWFLVCTFFIFASLIEFAFVNTVSRIQKTVPVKSFTAKSILPAAASVFATPAVSRKNSLENKKKGTNGGGTASRRNSLGSNGGNESRRFFVNKVSEGLQGYHDNNQLTVKSLDANFAADQNLRQRSMSLSVPQLPNISLPDGTELVFGQNKSSNDEDSLSTIDVADVEFGGRTARNSLDGGDVRHGHSHDHDSDCESTISRTSRFNLKKKFFRESMTSEEMALWIDQRAKVVFPSCFLIFNVFYWLFATRLNCTIFGGCDDETWDY